MIEAIRLIESFIKEMEKDPFAAIKYPSEIACAKHILLILWNNLYVKEHVEDAK